MLTTLLAVACALTGSLACSLAAATTEPAQSIRVTDQLEATPGTHAQAVAQALAQIDAAGGDTAPDRALAFDGIDDFVSVPAMRSMSYPGEGGWTVELWVKPVVYPHRGEASIIGQESVGVGGRDPWSLRIHQMYFEFQVDGPAGGSESVKFDLALGVWQHVACVYESTPNGRWVAVYVDGRLIARRETCVRMETRMDPVYFGTLTGTSFRGLIDDARVWSEALDENRVGLAMLGVVDPDDKDLRAWWAFDETVGGVALDRSRAGTHAVLGRPHDAFDGSAPARVLRTDD